MATQQIAPLLQAAISAASGLLGALIGGFISLRQSRESIAATLGNQIEIEELRFRQKLDFKQRQREQEAWALRRSLTRSMRRLHNTARLSAKSRVTLNSWTSAAETFEAKMENPTVDQLLSDSEYEALWRAANESRAAAMLLGFAAEGALQGRIPNVLGLKASIALFRESLRDAFAAVGETERAAEVSGQLEAGISGCGIFVGEGAVFYPDPADGKSFILR